MPALADLSSSDLASYEGKDIADICTTGFDGASYNHCAHFVSHVLELHYGLRCGSMKWETRGTGTSLRVNEIYNECSPRGAWADRPISTTVCMAFVTLPANMHGTEMGTHSRKHVGIYLQGTIWHYSNRNDKVTTDSAEAFHNKFKGAYGASTQMFYGVV